MRNLLLTAIVWCGVAAGAAEPGVVVTFSGDALLKGSGEAAGVAVAKVAPKVDLYIFPDLPATPKALWSSWGDGCVAADGKYYTSIGNHLDYDAGEGQARVYAYDPATKGVKLVVNVRDVVPDPRYAAGKIHGRIDQGRDGLLYFATYYGKTPEKGSEQTKASFIGSALLRYDPVSGKAEMLGAPVPKQGVPTSLTDAGRMILYGYAAYSDDFIVYDLAKRELKYRGGGDTQKTSRNLMLDRNGRVYYAQDDGGVMRYDPQTNRVTATKAKLPAGKKGGEGSAGGLRASTGAGADGVIYGATHGGALFAFDPEAETVKELGETWPGGQYTAVMERSGDGRFVYYAPGAHGSGARIGTPVVQWDVKAGTKKVLGYLNPAARERLNYNVGGTYNLKVSPDGSRLFVTFNGAMLDAPGKKEQTFGTPSVAVVEVPAAER
jgi:hypothetical protein